MYKISTISHYEKNGIKTDACDEIGSFSPFSKWKCAIDPFILPPKNKIKLVTPIAFWVFPTSSVGLNLYQFWIPQIEIEGGTFALPSSRVCVLVCIPLLFFTF